MAIKALIADDSCLDREVLACLLESAGVHDPVMARDGDEAIRLFDRERFDLVVTDWNMPKRSGLDVIRAIRARERGVPIIMVTAESGGIKRIAATDAGASDYCTKPLDPAAFFAVLTRHVDGIAMTSPG